MVSSVRVELSSPKWNPGVQRRVGFGRAIFLLTYAIDASKTVEICAVVIFAFAMIAGLMGESVVKRLIATALGVFFVPLLFVLVERVRGAFSGGDKTAKTGEA